MSVINETQIKPTNYQSNFNNGRKNQLAFPVTDELKT